VVHVLLYWSCSFELKMNRSSDQGQQGRQLQDWLLLVLLLSGTTGVEASDEIAGNGAEATAGSCNAGTTEMLCARTLDSLIEGHKLLVLQFCEHKATEEKMVGAGHVQPQEREQEQKQEGWPVDRRVGGLLPTEVPYNIAVPPVVLPRPNMLEMICFAEPTHFDDSTDRILHLPRFRSACCTRQNGLIDGWVGRNCFSVCGRLR
jgi:hypothetical protein